MPPFGRSIRVPLVLQADMTECGAACLAMVLESHGCYTPLLELRSKTGAGRDGASALGIVRVARAHGLVARGLKVPLSKLAQLKTPAILHWRLEHFVVLERVERRGAWVVDPAAGRRFVGNAELDGHFSGVALEFTPTHELPRRSRPRFGIWGALRILAGHPGALALVLFTTLLAELLVVLLPAANQLLVDHVVREARSSWLLPVVIGLGLVLVAQASLRMLRARLLGALSVALDLRLTAPFIQKLYSLPTTFFQQRSAGELGQRVTANHTLRELLTSAVIGVLDAVLLVSFAVLGLLYDARLAAVSLGMAAFRSLISRHLAASFRHHAATELALAGREESVVVEALGAPEVVKGANTEGLLLAEYELRLTARLNAGATLDALRTTHEELLGFVTTLGQCTVLLLGGWAVVRGEMTVGTLAGFLTIARLVDAPLESLAELVSRLAYAEQILDRARDVTDSPSRPKGCRHATEVRGRVDLVGVGFRFGTDAHWVLRDVSISIMPGEAVALVGASGAGKSTLAKLIAGELAPVEGQVLLDGVPLQEYAPQSLRQVLGYVPQDVRLLDASLEENLRLRCPAASDEQLEKAMRDASLSKVAERLPFRLQTRLGADGYRLSGGQRQRVALARSLVGEPRVLVLDEATSAIDVDTESDIVEACARNTATRVVVTHRAAALRGMHRVLRVEAGTVHEAGAENWKLQ